MEEQTVTKTLETNSVLTWMIAQEDFTGFNRCESVKSHKYVFTVLAT
jgi:hypothetical protein